MPSYFGPKARQSREVPAKVHNAIKRDIGQAMRYGNGGVFPKLDAKFLQMMRERHPNVRNLNQALSQLIVYEGVQPGGIKRGTVFLRHPTEEHRSAKIGEISWDASGPRMRPSHDQICWPIASLMDIEPKQVERD